MSSEIIFFQHFVDKNSTKAFSIYQQWTATVDIFLTVSNHRLFEIFSKHVSRRTVLTQTSVTACKWIF